MVTLPSFKESPSRLRGRNIRAGYERGWGLQFGEHRNQFRQKRAEHGLSP